MNPGKLPQSATEKSLIYTHAKSEKEKDNYEFEDRRNRKNIKCMIFINLIIQMQILQVLK